LLGDPIHSGNSLEPAFAGLTPRWICRGLAPPWYRRPG
jgi:hypothetical protein